MMMDSAIRYASHGYRVFPLHTVMVEGDCTCGRRECTAVGKHPRTEHGVKDATTDQEQVRRWWRSFPRSNIRLAMGNGLMVIDIDPRHGGSMETLMKIAPLPKTASVYTGGGGWHLYFTYDPTLSIRNSAGLLGQGIDVRGDGGHVVAPPSLQPRVAAIPYRMMRNPCGCQKRSCIGCWLSKGSRKRLLLQLSSLLQQHSKTW